MFDTFELRLDYLIKAKNLTQGEFAKGLGASPTFISNMICGTKKPGMDFLVKISEKYTVNLDWLLMGRGNMEFVMNRESDTNKNPFSQFIKLRMIKEITGAPVGNVLIDPSCIEAIEEYDSPLMKGCNVRLKPVVNGFHGDNDLIYKMQNEYDVAESLDDIYTLLNQYPVKV